MEGSLRPLVVGLALAAAACRGNTPPPGGEESGTGSGTASAYTSGADSGLEPHRREGTNTGVEFEAPRRIPGALAALDQVRRQPDQENLSAFRGDLRSVEDAMRIDLTRVGLADTGEFGALTDSLARDLGSGLGGLAEAAEAGEVPRLEAQVRRLVAVYRRMMGSVRK